MNERPCGFSCGRLLLMVLASRVRWSFSSEKRRCAKQVQYDKHTFHSNNLYQIFTYMKNKDAEFGDKPHEVSGMLLYAQTDEAIQPNNCYWMSSNKSFIYKKYKKNPYS